MSTEVRKKIQKAAAGEIKLPTDRNGRIKKISSAKKRKLLDHITAIKSQSAEIKDRLDDISDTIR